jgi:hypothetical protein
MLLPTVAVRETVPRRTYGISETLSKDSRWSQNAGSRPPACREQHQRLVALFRKPIAELPDGVGVENVSHALAAQRHARWTIFGRA